MAQSILELSERRGMDKQKALDSALAQIERNFGKGSIMKLGQQGATMEIEAVSTGSIGLDIALGIGGLPKGRIIEVYGPESSGKTTLALHVLAEEQKKGGICAFVDAEHALDPGYARKLGVDVDELLISQPDAGEQALEITDTLVRSGAVSVVVVDSVAALTPRSELEGDMGDASVGGDPNCVDAPRFTEPLLSRLGLEEHERGVSGSVGAAEGGDADDLGIVDALFGGDLDGLVASFGARFGDLLFGVLPATPRYDHQFFLFAGDSRIDRVVSVAA